MKYIEMARNAVRERGKEEERKQILSSWAGIGQDALAVKLGKGCCNWTVWTLRTKRRVSCSRSDTGTCLEDAESYTLHQLCRMELYFLHLYLLKSFDLHGRPEKRNAKKS